MNELSKWKRRAKALDEIAEVAINIATCLYVLAVSAGLLGLVIFGLAYLAGRIS